jgi:hypothetical protein
MTELNKYDYSRFYDDSYEAYEKYRSEVSYGSLIKVGDSRVFHNVHADSAIEAWITMLDNGHTPVYVKPKEHD